MTDTNTVRRRSAYTGKKKKFTFWLEDDLRLALTEESERANIPMATFIRAALREFLSKRGEEA